MKSVTLRRFCRTKLAVCGAVALIALVALAAAAPLVSPFPYDELHLEDLTDGKPIPMFKGKYLFGTDQFGRDYLTRCIFGGRMSLSVGFIAALISLLIGIPLGLCAGYFGGLADMAVMRFTELLSCIPSFFLILIANSVFHASIINVMAIIGMFSWMGICRQSRAQCLSLKEQDFVQSARAMGYSHFYIIIRYILPNALSPIIVSATLNVAYAIIVESSLSYLGLGVQEPTPSWGAMLKVGQDFLRTSSWLAVIPGLLILVVTLSLNFIGDGLRDALDPRASR
ncbi:MAG: ABC transporter permease [Clostridiales bacterium]|nr:ABC transporter permease [Clostridiales bacterium]MDR2752535.1 ABC transporter permease [Clostridiales bacterium]